MTIRAKMMTLIALPTLWDGETFEYILELRGHASYVHAFAFSPDGRQLATGSGESTIRIWDTARRPSARPPPAPRRGAAHAARKMPGALTP